MKLIVQNIISLLRGHKFFFFLTLLCIFVSAVLMLFGYGLYQNYMLEQQEFDSNSTVLFFDHPDLQKGVISKKELNECLLQISNDTLNKMEGITLDIFESDDPMPILITGFLAHFQIRDGVFQPREQIYKNGMQWNGAQGRYFTETEYAEGTPLMTVPPKHALPSGEGYYKIGDTMEIENTEFTIICLMGAFSTIVYTAVPDTVHIGYVRLEFTQPMTYSQYEEVAAAFAPLNDRLVMSEFVPFYDEDYWLYNTIMLVSVLIAVVAAFNLVVLYQYILLRRQKALAVCQICGCTKWKAIWTYSMESVLLIVPVYCIAALCYHYAMLPILRKVFPYIETAYSLRLYGLAFLILTAVCFLAMFVLSSYIVKKHTIVERKGGAT